MDYRIDTDYYFYNNGESSEDDYPERHQDQENSSQLVANLTLKGISEESLPPNIGLEFENDDAAWVMSCCFLIFTMQTGFGIYEAGKKTEQIQNLPHTIKSSTLPKINFL